MASAATLDALSALPAIDPETAALGHVLCALIGNAGMEVSLVRESDATLWFGARDDVRFTIARSGGHAAVLDVDRLGDTVALLDAVDPALIAIEQALELSLEPQTLDAGHPADAVIVQAADDDSVVLIAVPVAHAGREKWFARARSIAPSDAHMPIVVQCQVEGPRVAIAEAGELTAGDLILIGARVAAHLHASDGSTVAGQIEFASGLFAPHSQGGQMADTDAPPARDFAVPLTIRLPDRMTSAASLAALRPGTTLPLGPLTDGMAVDLLVAGRLLAKGELVQMGDRFGVLVEERATLEDVPPANAEQGMEDAE